MQAQLKPAYLAYRRVRVAVHIGLLGANLLLFWISGGFPPHAWLFLFHVIPQLPSLWQREGSVILPSLVGLLLLSTTLLLAWGMLILYDVRVASYWWQQRRELQRFQEDMQNAAQLATETQQEWEQVEKHTRDSEVSSKWDIVTPPDLNTNDFSFQYTGFAAHNNRAFAQTPALATMLAPGRVQTADYTEIDDLERMSTIPLPHDPAGLVSLVSPVSPVGLASGPLQLVVGTGLDVGIKRKKRPNQDSLLALQDVSSFTIKSRPLGLFIVADGMGGHQNGEEASSLAIQSMRNSILPVLEHTPADEVFTELLAEGVQLANLAIYQRNQDQRSDMGTTITAALIIGTTAYVVNVGDSRTYLYRPSSGLSQITRDHSIVAKLVAAGVITPDEVYAHPKRNEIYRSLGDQAIAEIDTFAISLQAGDLLLLCSDGLWEMVHDPEIEHIIGASLPYSSQISAMLVQAALNRGGLDNISVVVVSLCHP